MSHILQTLCELARRGTKIRKRWCKPLEELLEHMLFTRLKKLPDCRVNHEYIDGHEVIDVISASGMLELVPDVIAKGETVYFSVSAIVYLEGTSDAEFIDVIETNDLSASLIEQTIDKLVTFAAAQVTRIETSVKKEKIEETEQKKDNA